MGIKTTVNVSEQIRFRIIYAARITDQTGTAVIAHIMKNVMREQELRVEENRSVRYQKRKWDESWCRFHVSFVVRDYRYFTDMRNFYRCSVSYLVVYAVNKYLDNYIISILKKYKSVDSDNYPFENYILTKDRFDASICWTIYWGDPPKKRGTPS